MNYTDYYRTRQHQGYGNSQQFQQQYGGQQAQGGMGYAQYYRGGGQRRRRNMGAMDYRPYGSAGGYSKQYGVPQITQGYGQPAHRLRNRDYEGAVPPITRGFGQPPNRQYGYATAGRQEPGAEIDDYQWGQIQQPYSGSSPGLGPYGN